MCFGAGEGGIARFVATRLLFTGEQGFDGGQGVVVGGLTFNHDHQIAVFGVL